MKRKRNFETLLRARQAKYVLKPFLRLSLSFHNKSTKCNGLQEQIWRQMRRGDEINQNAKRNEPKIVTWN